MVGVGGESAFTRLTHKKYSPELLPTLSLALYFKLSLEELSQLVFCFCEDIHQVI